MEEQEIIKEALNHYGKANQVVVAIEELGELQKELCKLLRGKKDIEHIAEEIADVQIMLAQMIEAFGIAKMVNRQRFFKLHRLECQIARQRERMKKGGQSGERVRG